MAYAAALCQDSQLNITSKDTEVNGGLNLSVKWSTPNNAGPVLENSKGAQKKDKKQTCQEARRQKAAAAADDSGPSNAQNTSPLSSPAKAYVPSRSTTSREKLNDTHHEAHATRQKSRGTHRRIKY